jgi:hypothetical protein
MDNLFQLRKFAYSLKNSTMILLLEWNKVIKKLAVESTGVEKALTLRMMPRDVRTRWNSTYDMLKFAYTY